MSSESSKPQAQRTWLERIGQALIQGPKDRHDLLAILRDAEQSQILDNNAFKMLEGVLEMGQMQVRDIMIPRSQMVVVPEDMPPEECIPHIAKSTHSRFPVTGSSLDDIIGILHAKELLQFGFNKPQADFVLEDILKPAVFIPEAKRLDTLLNEFRKERNHLAIVVDEYGGVCGLITIEDVLEQIVGDIEDEYDLELEDTNINEIANNLYSVNGLTPIDDFNNYFDTAFSDDEFLTIAGIILHAFGHLPKKGETIMLEGFNFVVKSADSRRIHLVEVSKIN